MVVLIRFNSDVTQQKFGVKPTFEVVGFLRRGRGAVLSC